MSLKIIEEEEKIQVEDFELKNQATDINVMQSIVSR